MIQSLSSIIIIHHTATKVSVCPRLYVLPGFRSEFGFIYVRFPSEPGFLIDNMIYTLAIVVVCLSLPYLSNYILWQLDLAVLLRLTVQIKHLIWSVPAKCLQLELSVCPKSWFSNLRLKYLVTAANMKT